MSSTPWVAAGVAVRVFSSVSFLPPRSATVERDGNCPRPCAKKLGKGESSENVKPFIETLRVTNPVRQSRASSRKRVLRGGGQPSLRSVDSEIKRCVIEPRNFLVVSPRRGRPRGPSQALATLGPTSVPGHTGVEGTWRMIMWVLRELGRPCRLHRDCRPEPGLPTPG